MAIKDGRTPDDKNLKQFLTQIRNRATVDIPVLKEEPGSEWVKWGTNNLFPQTLIDGLDSSPAHNSIIQLKTEMTAGKRILIDPQKKGFLGKYLSWGANSKTEEFIKTCNENGESLHDVIWKMAMDRWAFGHSYFQPVFKGGGGLQIYHVPTDMVRTGKINTSGVIDQFYFSRSWKDYRKTEYKPITLSKFDYQNKRKQSLVPIASYRPGYQYYPVPDYYPAFNYILLDGLISRFHLSNMDNGLVPSMLIQFNQGVPPEEQREEMKRKMEETLTGAYNAGKFLLLFNDTKENAATIETLETTDIDKLYIALNEMVLQNIITASKLTSPLLIGIKTEGQLGTSSEIINSYQTFYNQIILPIQNQIMDEINKVGEMSGLQKMVIESPAPIDFVFSESVLGKILTRNELRNIIGYDSVEGGDEFTDYQKETENVPSPTDEEDTEKTIIEEDE